MNGPKSNKDPTTYFENKIDNSIKKSEKYLDNKTMSTLTAHHSTPPCISKSVQNWKPTQNNNKY